jgi:hypothetical protein
MVDIVNPGSTLTLVNSTGFTLTGDGTVPATSLLDGAGTIVGSFTLLNQGTIAADGSGAVLSIDSSTFNNQGTVLATVGTLIVQSSVATSNLSAGTLTGGVWQSSGAGVVELLSGLVTTDNATITLDGAASTFKSGSGTPQTIDNSLVTVGTAGVLNLLSGRNFTAGGSLIVNGTVTLAGGTMAATTGSIGVGTSGDVVGFGSIGSVLPIVDGGTIEANGGTLTLPQGSGISGTGTLQADASATLALQAFGSYSQHIVNNGTIEAVNTGIGGTLKFTGVYTGAGAFLINGGFDGPDQTVLELASGISGNVSYDSNFGELLLDNPSTFSGTIASFGNSDSIVLAGVANASTATLSGNVLTLTSSGAVVEQAVTLNTSSTDYSGATFNVIEAGGNTKAIVTVTGAVTCFTAGTRIMTSTGEVPVERLVAGDIVHTHFTGTAPVVWLGHRHVNCRRHNEPAKVWPILVSAHAFGPRMPVRDLLISPDHAVFVDGVLIPIKYLVNGKTITRKQMDEVTYYHVELAEHDVLLADGMPAESYLENGNRGAFDNAGGTIALHPDFGMRRWEAAGCAELVLTGAKLDAVMARVRARIPKTRPAARRIREVA